MLSVRRCIVFLSLVLWGFSLSATQRANTPTVDALFLRAHEARNTPDAYDPFESSELADLAEPIEFAEAVESIASAQSISESASTENIAIQLRDVLIRYEHAKAWPRWDYANNRAAYKVLVQVVKQLAAEGDSKRTIIIEGAASPIGSESYNKSLALRRAVVLKGIISRLEGGDKLNIHTVSTGEDWRTFAEYVREEYHYANRRAVLAILDSSCSNNEKERKLWALDKGKSWRLLVTKFMAPARNSVLVHIVESEPLVDIAASPLLQNFRAAEPILPFDLPRKSAEAEQTPLFKPVVAFRSNLLVPALNFGVEVPIGKHWSVAADYYYPWVWPKRDNKNCFELLSWGFEARYWFGRNRTVYNRLQGHSIGLYGYVGYYDFEYNFHGYQGEFANVGLDYTYAMAVGKKKRVNLEFSLGLGFIYSQARKYSVIEENAPLISDKITKTIGFFGPTKANISLVVPIFQRVKPNDKVSKR